MKAKYDNDSIWSVVHIPCQKPTREGLGLCLSSNRWLMVSLFDYLQMASFCMMVRWIATPILMRSTRISNAQTVEKLDFSIQFRSKVIIVPLGNGGVHLHWNNNLLDDCWHWGCSWSLGWYENVAYSVIRATKSLWGVSRFSSKLQVEPMNIGVKNVCIDCSSRLLDPGRIAFTSHELSKINCCAYLFQWTGKQEVTGHLYVLRSCFSFTSVCFAFIFLSLSHTFTIFCIVDHFIASNFDPTSLMLLFFFFVFFTTSA